MSETPCETCDRPVADGSTFCVGCAHRLDAALADVTAYRGLAFDLDVTLSRQAVMATRDGSRPTEAAVPYNGKASEVAGALKVALASWARLVCEETGDPHPADTITGCAVLLRKRVGWLRHHPAGAEAYGEILDGVADARRVVDRPPDRLYAGPCDCGEDLYARIDAAYVVCRSEEHDEPMAWPVEERRRWLLASAADVLATGTEISRALTRYAQPVTPSALRGYVHRGQLVSRGERVEGGRMVMLYRLGDVLDILTRRTEKATA